MLTYNLAFHAHQDKTVCQHEEDKSEDVETNLLGPNL